MKKELNQTGKKRARKRREIAAKEKREGKKDEGKREEKWHACRHACAIGGGSSKQLCMRGRQQEAVAGAWMSSSQSLGRL